MLKLSVFSVSMPEYNVKDTVELVKKIGFSGIEWRVSAPTPEEKAADYSFSRRYWSNNRSTIDFDHPKEEMLRAKQLCDAAGVEICAMANYKPVSDYHGVVLGMEAAAAVGCHLMRVGIPRYEGNVHYSELFQKTVQDIKQLIAPSQEYGVKILMETHMDTIIPSASAAYRLACNFDPACVGVLYDPGNMVYEGYEQHKMGFEILGEYLAHVHVKNAKWIPAAADKPWYVDFSPMDQGVLNAVEFIQLLRNYGYNGYVSVEDFSNEDDTATKLEKVYKLLGPLFDK